MVELICPNCKAKMVLRQTAKYTYKDGSPQKFWGCSMFPECKTTHGAHPDGKPLGRPGTAEEKKARIAAHDAFDPLWQSGAMSRRKAYKWLSKQLGAETHIGAADVALCDRIIAVCEAELARLREPE